MTTTTKKWLGRFNVFFLLGHRKYDIFRTFCFFHLHFLKKTKKQCNNNKKKVCAPYMDGFYTDMISVRLTDKLSSTGQGDNLASRISARFHLFFLLTVALTTRSVFFPELCLNKLHKKLFLGFFFFVPWKMNSVKQSHSSHLWSLKTTKSKPRPTRGTLLLTSRGACLLTACRFHFIATPKNFKHCLKTSELWYYNNPAP